MLNFVFSPAIQALIAAGSHEIVRTASGHFIGIVRDKATGRFAGHARAVVVRNSPLAPLVTAAQFAILGAQ
jgi:formylmethanofuran dehydrogenase subunit E-like metal-binding protein